MPRSYRATVLPGSTTPGNAVSIVAPTDFEAMMRAREILGSVTTFALHEGDRHVITFRPSRGPAADVADRDAPS